MNQGPGLHADTADAPGFFRGRAVKLGGMVPTRMRVLCLLCLMVTAIWSSSVCAAGCTVSTTAVAFGHYDPLSATARNRTGRITVRCSGRGTFSVALSTGASGSYNPRYMHGGAGEHLDYNLYINAARTIVFGDGTGGTETEHKAFNNNTKRVPVYGQIPAMENITAGNYADNIIVTVSF